MDQVELDTMYQHIVAEKYPQTSIVELNFSKTTLYLPGDHFRYNGQVYIVKKCYQAGDAVWRLSSVDVHRMK